MGRNKFNYDWWSLVQAYKQYVTKTSVVLEIGASRPERTYELCQYCKSLTGLELIPERTPRNFENVTYVTGDWQQLSSIITPSSIDVVVASHVIEHVPDDLRALNELYKVLKSDGVALINTPNRQRFTRRFIEIFTGKREFPYWEHQREYVKEDIEDLLARSLFDNYDIIPLVLGIHGGPVFCYLESVPGFFTSFANYWEIHLFKTEKKTVKKEDK
jgi:SAM-dependent methyltransferase